MRTGTLTLFAFVTILALGIAAATGKDPGETTARAAFDRLKSLQGQWLLNGTEQVQSEFEVTAGGSVLLETLFPGTDKEMLTLYHLDGDDLVLTHYCVLGNQPRMKAAKLDGPNQLVFDFAGGTSLNPGLDTYMRDARITFHGEDRFVAEWSMYKGDDKVEVKSFDLVRKQ